MYEPSETSFSEQEDAMTELRGEVITSETITRGRKITNYLYTSEDYAVDFTDDENVYKALNAKVNVAKVGASKGRHEVTSESLSHKWLVLPEAARRKVQHTTHRGIRKILHLSLLQWFRTNNQALRYNRLHKSFFADTMLAGIVSRRGNRYAQVYSTKFGWSRAHPMKRKGDAHESLYLFFKRDGVPHKMVMGVSKEKTLGSFRKKCQEVDFHIKQMEPYYLWQL